MINYEDFEKVEIKIGHIQKVEQIKKAEKLLLLTVDFAEENPRTVVSGIKKYFDDLQILEGKKVGFITNLEPRSLMGYESQAMIMGAKDSDSENFSLLEVSKEIPAGTKVS